MKSINQTYDYLCKRFDKIFKENNLCDFDSNGRCCHYRKVYKRIPKSKCCCYFHYKLDKCKYVTGKGCRTQNLLCKTYKCDTVWTKLADPKYLKARRSIYRLMSIYYEFYDRYVTFKGDAYYDSSKRLNLYNYFKSKTELLLWIKTNNEKQS